MLSILEALANPLSNGSYDATFARGEHHYQLKMAEPGAPIEVMYSQEVSSSASAEPLLALRSHLIYHPDGKISHTTTFDSEGHPQGHSEQTPERLRGRAASDHSIAINFLEQRHTHLNRSFGAYTRLQAPLQHLRGRHDLGNRAIWFDNFAVLGDKIYTLRKYM